MKKPNFVGRMSADFENIGSFYISLEHFKSVCQQNCWSISFEGECNFYTQCFGGWLSVRCFFVFAVQKEKKPFARPNAQSSMGRCCIQNESFSGLAQRARERERESMKVRRSSVFKIGQAQLTAA